MDDISDVIQQARITVEGDDIVLPAVSFKHWGIIQKGLIKKKKQGILGAALEMRGLLTPMEFEELRSAALQECGRIRACGLQDLQEMLSNEDGIGLILWVLVDDVRKGKYTEEQVRDSVESMTEDDSVFVIDSFRTVLGITDEKEEEDADPNEQSEEAAPSSH